MRIYAERAVSLRRGLFFLALASVAFAPRPSAAAQHDHCRILVTDDNGIADAGLLALAVAMKSMCDVLVVAPAKDESGMSHAVPDARRGFAAKPVVLKGALAGYAVEGTPAEAVALGLIAFGAGNPFDLVVSGIDNGENTGLANLYSGTVNAGMEALVRGVPAVAFSQAGDYGDDYSASTAIARRIVRQVLAKGLPKGVMLNVNIPRPAGAAIRVLPAAGLSVVVRGFSAQPLGGGLTLYKPILGAAAQMDESGDAAAFAKGGVTIVPLALDRTDAPEISELRGWDFQDVAGK